MSKCKFCKKKIKWLEVVDEKSASGLRWKPFNPAARGTPATPHDCQSVGTGTTLVNSEAEEKPKPPPWWLND